MIVGLKNDRITDMDELRKVAENYIRNELVRIEGVADVRLVGKEESEVVIETNKYLLESFGLTSDGIAAQVSNYNRNVSGGSIVDMGTKYVVKGVSVLENLEDLENIIVGFKQHCNILSPHWVRRRMLLHPVIGSPFICAMWQRSDSRTRILKIS